MDKEPATEIIESGVQYLFDFGNTLVVDEDKKQTWHDQEKDVTAERKSCS